MNKILLDSINQKAYGKDKVLGYYDKLDELFPAEKRLFEMLNPKIRNAKILDIGIGGGRTTRYLLSVSSDYTGVDYLPQFIERVKGKFKSGNFLCADARNLSEFDDETFDFVLFSYNGIDAVSHQDRLKILMEVHRVLKENGTFMFSSHNRDYRYFQKPYWLVNPRLNPTFIKNLISYFFFLPKHLQMKKYEIFSDEYAVVNDCDHRYSLLIYYINIANQVQQLEEIGFAKIEAYNAPGESVTSDTDSHWIYYLAEKS